MTGESSAGFLAAMSSSSSDNVTQSVRSSVRPSVRPSIRPSVRPSVRPCVRPGPFFILSLQAYLTLPFVVNDVFFVLQTV